MTERLQKIIAARGLASRRQAEEMIESGRVTCNGRICRLGESADPDIDVIAIDGTPLPTQQKHVYILLHKPRGYVTTLSDDRGRPTAAQLIADCGVRVYPVGRLDMDSEGLLLFTNDGDFANTLMHPSHEVCKTYRVTVSGYSDAALERLRQPVRLDGYLIRRPQVQCVHADGKGGAELEVTIHEGRNRQVRRMCDMAGMRVMRLIRIREGMLPLGDLRPGQWRHLTASEVANLLPK